MEAEIKNMMKSLDSYEKDLGNIEVSKKENNAKLAKLVQWIEFSNTTLKTYESTLKEKKAQWEEVKRNLQGAKVDNFEEAGEAVGKQLEQAEKKYQENQNYIVRLKQKVSQIKEQLEMEKGMVDNSLNSRYFFFL
jgi:chromosome segregation ATPase